MNNSLLSNIHNIRLFEMFLIQQLQSIHQLININYPIIIFIQKIEHKIHFLLLIIVSKNLQNIQKSNNIEIPTFINKKQQQLSGMNMFLLINFEEIHHIINRNSLSINRCQLEINFFLIFQSIYSFEVLNINFVDISHF